MRVLTEAARAVPTTAVAVAAALAVAAAGPAEAHSGTSTPAASGVSQTSAMEAWTQVPAFAGHTYRLQVDNGVVYQNSYSADGTSLHWEAVEGPFKGNSGDEKLSVRKIRDDMYHVNWVESSGMTVSHVMDLADKTVSVYWTYVTADGNRVGELHTASLTRIA